MVLPRTVAERAITGRPVTRATRRPATEPALSHVQHTKVTPDPPRPRRGCGAAARPPDPLRRDRRQMLYLDHYL